MEDLNIHNLEPGDVIIVNDKLREWISRRGWGNMFFLIGKKLTIKYLSSERETIRVNFKETDHWIPIQCIDPVDEKNTIYIKWYKKGKLEK